jgi:hypothetical protein
VGVRCGPLICRSPRMLSQTVSGHGVNAGATTIVRYVLILVAALVAAYALILLIALMAAYEWLP